MSLSAYKEKAFDLFDTIQERARNFWSGLNPREKVILASLSGVLAVLLISLIFKFTLGAYFYRQAQIQEAMNNASKIQRLADEIRSQKTQLTRYERLKRRRGEEFNLQRHLENQSRRYGVSLKEVKPKRAQKGAQEDEELFEVVMEKNTTLDGALRFLSGAEEALGVRIVDLRIKTSFTDPTKLEVVAVVGNTKDL